MKKIILIVALALITGISFGQKSHGRNQLNLGVGLSQWGVPVYIGIDHYVNNDVSLGGEFSYRDYRENWENRYYNRNIMGFSGNANYHFNRILELPSDWDFYAGLNIGYYVWNTPTYGYYGDHSTGLGLGGQIGVRYYLSNKVALNLEFGGGNAFSGGKFGLTFKF